MGNLNDTIAKIAELGAQLQRINSKTAQAIRIRTRIVQEKDKAVNDLSNIYIQKLPTDIKPHIQILSRIQKNEINLMDILDKNIKQTMESLAMMLEEFKKISNNSEFTGNIRNLLELLDTVYNHLENIKARMMLEGRYLATLVFDDFIKFWGAWEKELKVDNKFLNKLDPAKINNLGTYFDRIVNLSGVSMVAAIMGTGFYSISPNITSTPTSQLYANIVSAVIGVLGIVGLVNGLSDVEASILADQRNAAKKLKEVV